MSSIQESIFKAVDIITEKKIRDIKFDKTLDCIIEDDSKADKGEYTVKYQDIIMPVFSSSNTVKYRKDDNVYVLIPQGDMSNKKTIVGKKESTGEEFLDIVDLIDKVQKIGANYVDEPEGSVFSFDSGSNQKKKLLFRNEDFIVDYKYKTNLLVAANIVTDLLNENGDYGIELDLTYLSGVQHRYRMSMNSIVGNPYRLEGRYQYKVFPLLLDEVATVNGAYLYIEGFPTQKKNAIAFSNVEIIYAKPREVEGLEQFLASLKTPKGNTFKNGIINPTDSLDIEVELTKAGNVFNPGAAHKWFFMDSTVTSPDIDNGWDSDGGLGWRLIDTAVNDYSGALALNEDGSVLTVKADFVPNLETFKCVATFGGEIVEFPDGTQQHFGAIKLGAMTTIVDQTDAITIDISSTMGDVFKQGDGIKTTDLIAKVMVGAEQITSSKFLYSWSELNKDGTVTPIATLQSSEKLTINVESDIINTENYICEVFLKE